MKFSLPAIQQSFETGSHFRLNTPPVTLSGGGYTCIIGLNGSGKSTYAQSLTRTDLTHDWHYVPQFLERFLFATCLQEQLNELFSIPPDRPTTLNLLSELGFPEDDQYLDFPFLLMSGGERRRMALACALYAAPEFLILDEPDIGLPPKESMVILTKLNNLRANETKLLVISHNPLFIKDSSDLICLKDGTVDRVGKTQELLSDPGFDLGNYGIRSN